MGFLVREEQQAKTAVRQGRHEQRGTWSRGNFQLSGGGVDVKESTVRLALVSGDAGGWQESSGGRANSGIHLVSGGLLLWKGSGDVLDHGKHGFCFHAQKDIESRGKRR